MVNYNNDLQTSAAILRIQEYLINSGVSTLHSDDSRCLYLLRGYKPVSYVYPIIWQSWRRGDWPYEDVRIYDYYVDYLNSISLAGEIWVLRTDIGKALPITDSLIAKSVHDKANEYRIVPAKDLIGLDLADEAVYTKPVTKRRSKQI